MIRPLFANKMKVRNKITLDDSQSIKNDQKVGNIFNYFFMNTASNLKVFCNKSLPHREFYFLNLFHIICAEK